MAITARSVEYYYTRVENEPRFAYELLERLAAEDINLLAFSAVPYGENHVELTMFPERTKNFKGFIGQLGCAITGPQHAILIQGDDRLGELANIHKKLDDAKVHIYSSTGVTDGQGHYGYVIYTKEGDHATASKVLDALS